MFHEAPMPTPIVADPREAIEAMAAAAPSPPHQVPSPTSEQVQAAEAIFAAEERESRLVAGLLGMWTGTMLLHDLAKEHLSPPADELEHEDPRLRKPRRD
jgi:hypothetical protein